MTMKKANYTKPACAVILPSGDLMESMPTGVSGNTDSGDDIGGGLSKKGFIFTDEEENKFENYQVWEDE